MKRRARNPVHSERAFERATTELKRLQATADHLRAGGDRGGTESLQHELSVYQEELVIQNEALIGAQSMLEETRDRFIELYDFAPNGYLTLDRNGVVRECNLTAAAMIGKSRSALEGLTLLALVDPDDRAAMMRFLRHCRTGADAQVEAEFRFRTANGPRRMQLLCRGRATAKGTHSELFASMIDVTERRQLEGEREQLAREHAALAGQLLSAQEDERQQIARDLHDDLGQQMTALRLALERVAAGTRQPDMRAQLALLLEAVGRADRSLHRISAGLRPATLDLGIVPAVRQCLDDWSALSGVAVSLRADDLPDQWLAPDVDTQLFRILQEALTNVGKHSGARQVSVEIKRLNSGVSLVVTDDGRGFDVNAAAAARTGLGLIGIRERVQLVGGRLSITASEGRGTTVSVAVPRTLAERL